MPNKQLITRNSMKKSTPAVDAEFVHKKPERDDVYLFVPAREMLVVTTESDTFLGTYYMRRMDGSPAGRVAIEDLQGPKFKFLHKRWERMHNGRTVHETELAMINAMFAPDGKCKCGPDEVCPWCGENILDEYLTKLREVNNLYK